MARKKKEVDKIQDAVFGELEWDDTYDWWLSELEIAPGHSIEVSIFGRDLDAVLETRRAMFVRIRDTEPELRAAIAAKMLELAEHWRDEDEDPDPITLESFTKRMKMTSILMHTDQLTELFYDDDDIFAGHVILANIDANGLLEDANIAG
jgi:hypothetical protein